MCKVALGQTRFQGWQDPDPATEIDFEQRWSKIVVVRSSSLRVLTIALLGAKSLGEAIALCRP
jgi:hypothetical protein